MPQLAPMADHCRTASDVRACARAVCQRRMANYERPVTLPLPVSQPESTGQEYVTELPPPAPLPPPPPRPHWRSIVVEVSRQSGTPAELILSSSRHLPEMSLRQLSVALSRKLAGLSLPALGRRFGGRDHSTIISSISRMRGIISIVETKLNGCSDPAQWVAKSLPLLEAHISQIRCRYRQKGKLYRG
jgi:hypothetical protein